MMHEHDNRVLSDEDVEAIADKLLEKVEAKVYHDMGKGLWGIASKLILAAMIGLAAYGAVSGKMSWPSSTQ
jgi:uncharacterized protein YqeY